MIESNSTEFRRKLDEFSARLSARTQEFERSGEFSDVHKNLLDKIRLGSDQLRTRVADAEQRGMSWELVKAEAARDYGALFDNFSALEERLDAESMKRAQKK